jgi:multisubunit Na+/H+ antiporter MnhE subunit
MATVFWLSIPLALVWILITRQISIDSFIIGYWVGFVINLLLHPKLAPYPWRKLPRQFVALVLYGLALYRDIVLSGLDIARRVLSVDMRLKPGVVAVPIQDGHKTMIIAALSANAISLAPGELVTEIKDNAILYIHTLDVDQTAKRATAAQKVRLVNLNLILGRGN